MVAFLPFLPPPILETAIDTPEVKVRIMREYTGEISWNNPMPSAPIRFERYIL